MQLLSTGSCCCGAGAASGLALLQYCPQGFWSASPTRMKSVHREYLASLPIEAAAAGSLAAALTKRVSACKDESSYALWP